jgi:GNAT superfamily N-acetyltransferase
VLTLRLAASDADLELWRQVRLAVVPGERADSVAGIRASDSPARLLLIAEQDGVLAGSGIADDSSLTGGFVCPRVLPAARRRGVGTAMLRALAQHCQDRGHATVAALADDEGSAAFARWSGFTEVNREVEMLRTIGDEPPPEIPAGVEIVTAADRPGVWDEAYDRVHATLADTAHGSVPRVSREEWHRDWTKTPEASFAALAGGEVIGVASLLLDPGQPTRAETGYTAVRREWRGKGVADALKRSTLAWAAGHGIAEVYTWTQQGNARMRAVNERLGYRYGIVSVRLESPLPLRLP